MPLLATIIRACSGLAWLQFFANHPNALASLDEIGALPENATSIQQTQADAADRPDTSPPPKPGVMTDEHQRVD